MGWPKGKPRNAQGEPSEAPLSTSQQSTKETHMTTEAETAAVLAAEEAAADAAKFADDEATAKAAEEAKIRAPKKQQPVKVQLLYAYWNENEERCEAGEEIALPSEQAAKLVKAGKAVPV